MLEVCSLTLSEWGAGLFTIVSLDYSTIITIVAVHLIVLSLAVRTSTIIVGPCHGCITPWRGEMQDEEGENSARQGNFKTN